MLRRLPAVAYFYLAMAVAGAIIPWTFNILAMRELGRSFSASEFVMAGFQGSALVGSVAADFWIGATASFVWMLVEARRCQMRRPWVLVLLTMLVAWACALPLFLFLRERHLSRVK
jgi:Terpene cyclase DEP1